MDINEWVECSKCGPFGLCAECYEELQRLTDKDD